MTADGPLRDVHHSCDGATAETVVNQLTEPLNVYVNTRTAKPATSRLGNSETGFSALADALFLFDRHNSLERYEHFVQRIGRVEILLLMRLIAHTGFAQDA